MKLDPLIHLTYENDYYTLCSHLHNEYMLNDTTIKPGASVTCLTCMHLDQEYRRRGAGEGIACSAHRHRRRR